ncbi:reverse transcriptase [Necator americanus]|uniref:Reverse transcriptase n=1 Tax=Necator americanus TaxID=51031 RepID=W2T0R7_NECAM|nr:reverse transcriptase [Necator americanus]ETN75600.1 reverse transcriptase [Necator americanus]
MLTLEKNCLRTQDTRGNWWSWHPHQHEYDNEYRRSRTVDDPNRTFGEEKMWINTNIDYLQRLRSNINHQSNKKGKLSMYMDLEDFQRENYELYKAIAGDFNGKNAIHAVRILLEKDREKNRSVHLAFLDLEEAFDRVPRELLWMSMRSHRVPEEYVRWIKLLHAKPTSVVRCAAGTSRPFPIQVGAHQGSPLSPLLFILCMDTITKEIQKQHPWALLFADDVMFASESRDDLQKQVLEGSAADGLRLNTSKTEYMECGPRIEDGSIRVDGTELNKVNCFKYLGSKVTSTSDIDQ